MIDILKAVNLLDLAYINKEPINQLTCHDMFDLKIAYAIQKNLVSKRIFRGNKLKGIKLGFTSEAKRIQMGINDIILGFLTEDMEILNNNTNKLNSYLHPRVEPEIVFKLKYPIGYGYEKISSLKSAINCIECITAGIEIIDSRYKNFKFSLPDVIADNASSSSYSIGTWNYSYNLNNIDNLKIIMKINNNIIEGNSSAIMGNPLYSIIAADNLLHELEVVLPAGNIILAGAATNAVEINESSHIENIIQHIGNTSINLE
jgi:2-oxo-3-hexenedioate decarboxylase